MPILVPVYTVSRAELGGSADGLLVLMLLCFETEQRQSWRRPTAGRHGGARGGGADVESTWDRESFEISGFIHLLSRT